MTDDNELDESERSVLDAWAPLTPPPGFADRVMAAHDIAHARSAPRRRAKWPVIVAGVLAAAAMTIVIVTRRDPSHAATGSLVDAKLRTTTALGDRAVAVAEPSATLSWRIDDDGNAVIDQRGGDVFYRVDRGGSFVVHTPAGDVRVTGTCFRIEIKPMTKTKQLVLSGTIGAAVATGAVITVYEGHVIADSRSGGRAEVAAGNRATMGPDGRMIVAAVDAPDRTEVMVALDEKTATREQLIARAAQQQIEITKLRSILAEVEKTAGRDRSDDTEEGRAWYDPSPEKLTEWVAECRVRADEPGFDRWQPITSLGKNERGLEPAELAQVNAAMTDIQTQWKALVKQLYVEATGDVPGSESLSTEAMRREIEEKGNQAEHNLVLQRVAMERAGQAQPPADLSKASPFERMFRAYIKLGDQTEAALAKKLGAERAKAIRGDGWGSRSNWSGCPRTEE
jgi:hypothetical protein